MKTIIAGGRFITDYQAVEQAISESGFKITEVVSGHCYLGVDVLGELWAYRNHIPLKFFPANWSQYGRAAGPIRNSEMAQYADACIVVWNGKSRGSADMLRKARARGLATFEKVI